MPRAEPDVQALALLSVLWDMASGLDGQAECRQRKGTHTQVSRIETRRGAVENFLEGPIMSTSLEFPGIALIEYECECDLGALIDAALSHRYECRSVAIIESRSMDLKRTWVRKRSIAIQRINGC
jgi:hypothetical protein